MALFRRAGRSGDLGSSFRNNKQLQKFVLTDVTPTGRSLGVGSYGSVEEVVYRHLPCAGKKLHEALLDAQNEGVPEMVQKYLEECQLMSSLRHPNVTQFLGIWFLPGTQLPLLVMEQLETSLDDLLEHMPHLPISLKCSVLEDVASGLLYLHKGNPPVIHRDLTAKNVLLTSHLAAKITDMGNSRIIDMKPGRLAQTLSKLPGTLVYMPPEALDDRHSYGPPLDVFSFGHLALFTVLQTFPGDLLPSTYPNPDNPSEVRGRTELERRGKYVADLEAVGRFIPASLVELIKQSLHNVPDKRPSTDELLTRLQRMRSEMEGAQGGSPMNLDIMIRVRMAKEMKMKERRMEEIFREQKNALLEEKDRDLEEKNRELREKDRELDENRREFESVKRQLEERNRDLNEKLEELRTELQQKDIQLKDKDAEICRLGEELRKPPKKEAAAAKEVKVKPAVKPKPTAVSTLPVYVAKHTLEGQEEGQLSFKKGDIMYIVSTDEGEWWFARSKETGKEGYIPRNFVAPLKGSPNLESSQNVEIDRGQIQLKKKLGAGQLGEVWEGTWKGALPVAVRAFKPGILISTAKLLEEVMLMRKLDHPKLVHVYGVCIKEEPVYLVMELMKQNLLDYLRGDGRALKLPQLIDIAAQVAAGMAYLEKEGYTHGNLTARNILVGENGVYNCKLGDYGMDNVANDFDAYDTICNYRYPIKWMAPEAAIYSRFSIKSDVWSFGILLHEVITYGRFPYPGKTNAEVLELLQTGYRMPRPPGCPEKLYSIILACWKDKPEDRPTFESLQWQLEDFFVTDDAGYTDPDRKRVY